jgi:hypothetical protein
MANKAKPARFVKCLVQGCGQPAVRRGLCDSCYRAARYQIARYGKTWDALEAEGFALPLVVKHQSAFTAAYNAAAISSK